MVGFRGILISSSSNALETAVFGKSVEETVWLKYDLDDTERAEFPLGDANDETYSHGIAIDKSSQQPVVISMFMCMLSLVTKVGGFSRS